MRLCDREYFDSLPTAALLAEADKAFGESDYKKSTPIAIIKLARAVRRQDHEDLFALYQCHQLGRTAEGRAFIRPDRSRPGEYEHQHALPILGQFDRVIADNDLRSQLRSGSEAHCQARPPPASACRSWGTAAEAAPKTTKSVPAARQSVRKSCKRFCQQTRSKSDRTGYRDNIIGSGSDDAGRHRSPRWNFVSPTASRLRLNRDERFQNEYEGDASTAFSPPA